MKKRTAAAITRGAVIATLYVVLTVAVSAVGLAGGAVQIRISEALCVLPTFTPAAIPGLFIGCFLANLLTGASIFDVLFGSLSTLLGACGTYLLRKRRFLCTIPPVLANALIIPLVLVYAYGLVYEPLGVGLTYLIDLIGVGIGEVCSVCVLGSLLFRVLQRYENVLFRDEE